MIVQDDSLVPKLANQEILLFHLLFEGQCSLELFLRSFQGCIGFCSFSLGLLMLLPEVFDLCL